MIDIGFLKNIDFTNSDNLLFFSIVLFLAIIIFIVLLFVISGILKSFIGLFKLEKKAVIQGKVIYSQAQDQNAQAQPVFEAQPKKRRKFLEWVEITHNKDKANDSREKEKISDELRQFEKKYAPDSGDTLESKMPSTGNEEEKNGFEKKFEEIKIPVRKHSKIAEWFSGHFKKKAKPNEKSGIKKSEATKEKERISKQLEQFKKETSLEKGDTSESKMPRMPGQESEENSEIKIPVAKKFAPQAVDSAAPPASPAAPKSATSHGVKLSMLKDKKSQITGGGQAQADVSESDRMELLKGKEVKIVKGQNVHAGDVVGPVAGEGQGEFFDKPEFMKDGLGMGSSAKKGTESRAKGGSILFGNKEEVSRDELKEKLGKDSSVWKASKDTGLGFNSLEREHIEEIFPQSMGGNISKSDLKSIIKKIDQKRASITSPAKKDVLRRGSNFLKKIGGVK